MTYFDSPEEKLKKLKSEMEWQDYHHREDVRRLQTVMANRKDNYCADGLCYEDVEEAIDERFDVLNDRLNRFIRAFAREIRNRKETE